MNIDGATGVVFAELGFPPLCRGVFVLSRSVGALAHAFEELLSGERNKGPIPRQLIWSYTGPPARELPRDRAGGSTYSSAAVFSRGQGAEERRRDPALERKRHAQPP